MLSHQNRFFNAFNGIEFFRSFESEKVLWRRINNIRDEEKAESFIERMMEMRESVRQTINVSEKFPHFTVLTRAT